MRSHSSGRLAATTSAPTGGPLKAALRSAAAMAGGFVLAVGLASCGGETPTAYNSENEEAFLASCVDADTDGIFQQRVCRCVYDEAEASVPFERFLEINDELADMEETVMPDDLVDLVALCVIEEGDL